MEALNMPEEEAANLEQEVLDRNADLANRPALRTEVTESVDRGADGAPGFYNNFWLDRGTRAVGTRRTSLIIDLPNGGMPPLTPEAMQRAERQRAARDASSPTRRQTVSEELASLDPGVVCRGGRIPMCGRGYNSNYQILQTADYVTLQDGDDA